MADKGATKGNWGQTPKYEQQMCRSIIARAKLGDCKEQRAKAIGIDPVTYRRWCDPEGEYYNPEFAEAENIAHNEHYCFWLDRISNGVIEIKDGPKLNPQVTRLYMDNVFGWGENHKNHNTNDTTIDVTISKPQAPKE